MASEGCYLPRTHTIYATVTIYMGRPSIFLQNERYETNSESSNRVAMVRTFSADCVQSAVRIIDLCQLLQDSVGLARVSYTGFSSCRAALLVLVAQRRTQSSERTCNALTRGMGLIRHERGTGVSAVGGRSNGSARARSLLSMD